MSNSQHNSDKTSSNGNLGKYLKGGPGRPIGSGNRFATLKNELATATNQRLVLDIWQDMLNGSKTDRREALKLAFQLLPREDKLQHELAELVINKNVLVTKCHKCGHDPDTCNTTQVIDTQPLKHDDKPST